MIFMMKRWQQRRQQLFASSTRPRERLRERKNKKHDPLLCKCLAAMGMYRFVDRFDSFTQFVCMSPDQCRLYGPEFVVEYDKLHARIEVLCANTFSALDAACCKAVYGEPHVAGASSAPSAASEASLDTIPVVAATQEKNLAETAAAAAEEEEEGGHGNGVQPRRQLRPSDSLSPDGDDGGGLIPCTEEFGSDDDFNDAQTVRVCSHLVGTCDAVERWFQQNFQN